MLASKILADYHYELPEDLISAYPRLNRTDSLLLVLDLDNHSKTIHLQDKKFDHIVDFLQAGDILIVNNTRVSARRLYLERIEKPESNKKIECLFLEELSSKWWSCLLKPKSKLKQGERLGHPLCKQIEFIFSHAIPQEQQANQSYLLPVETKSDPITPAWKDTKQAELWFANYGQPPIPPYLKRQAEALDRQRYQTVYAKQVGSAAAPTAGLHFSIELLTELSTKRGVEIETLDLQLGYGTFSPLKQENFSQKRLHRESYHFPKKLAQRLNTRTQGRRIAVGTSSLRALEDNFRRHGGTFVGGSFTTELFIHPPDTIQCIDGLITNFHLPASSLLLLTACYTGREAIMIAYQHAIKNHYRFFSYGDAMLILKKQSL